MLIHYDCVSFKPHILPLLLNQFKHSKYMQNKLRSLVRLDGGEW